MEYKIEIENADKPLERNVLVSDENNAGVYSYYGGDYIEVYGGLCEGHLVLNKETFLTLYEMMTQVKKFIDD